jgi:hypothetical protein
MALRNISNSINKPIFYEQSNLPNRLKINKLSLSISSSSSASSDIETNSAQIRTSSPISSSSSSQTDLFSIAPVSFNTYAKSKESSKKVISKHVSIRELAYEKLKKQQQRELRHQQKHQQQQQQELNKNKEINNIRSNGKLKIAAYNNVGHLTIHIIKGRSYRSSSLKTNDSTDTYVKLNMIPDIENSFQQCQTMLVKHYPKSTSSSTTTQNKHQETINYDDKFSFELNNQIDLNNRLVISVWSRQTIAHSTTHPHIINSLSSSASSISTSSSASINNNSHLIINDQLIGCFSFKIKNLIKEPITPQWYHLLSEQQGINKHFRCHRPAQSQKYDNGSSDNNNYEQVTKQITNLNKDLIGMERVRIRVTRPNELENYGFTIVGNCPCMIGKVDSTKQAYNSGLKSGDYLSSINNKNVSRATCESVVKLIKSVRSNYLDIEVCREKIKVINTVITRPQVQHQLQTNLINPQTIPNYQFRQVVQQPQQQQQPILVRNTSLYPTNQINTNNCLEVVMEEDENNLSEASLINGQEEEDDDQEQCCFDQLEEIRHVDSSDINSDLDDFKFEQLKEEDQQVEEMRRVAAKYYSNEQHQQQQLYIRQANIMSLKNLKIN